jgi:hypothetical protein
VRCRVGSRGALNEATFESWFGDAEGLALSDDAFTLSVPNDSPASGSRALPRPDPAAVKDATGHERRIQLSVRDEAAVEQGADGHPLEQPIRLRAPEPPPAAR